MQKNKGKSLQQSGETDPEADATRNKNGLSLLMA